jgi:hypothetical protein
MLEKSIDYNSLLDDWADRCYEEMDKCKNEMTKDITDLKHNYLRGYQDGISMSMAFLSIKEKRMKTKLEKENKEWKDTCANYETNCKPNNIKCPIACGGFAPIKNKIETKEDKMKLNKVPCYYEDKIVGYSIIKDNGFTTTITDKELSKLLVGNQKVGCCSIVGFSFEEHTNCIRIFDYRKDNKNESK